MLEFYIEPKLKMDNCVRKEPFTLGNIKRKKVEPSEEMIQFVYERMGDELQEVVAVLGDQTDWLQYCDDHQLVTLRKIYEKRRTTTP
jgi:hypothetical protein